MATTSPMSLEPSATTLLKYSSFRSQLDPAFWFELSQKKLNEWKLDTELQKAHGIYASALHPTVSGDGTIELSNSAFEPSLYDPAVPSDSRVLEFRPAMLLPLGGLRTSTPW